jgi:hypothetical protein
MGYISRYIREHYVKRNIRKELYDRFIRWCGEASINLCLEKALKILEANIGANIAPNIGANMGADVSTSKPATLTPNIAPNIGANTASQTTATVKTQTRERRRVIVFTLEWASQKGIDTEEYMARKEKEGYICNETSRKVYCIWREDIEQLVVELNSSNAKMGELENVLSGEKLEIARKAIEAGLLWYDSKDKRWRAPL